MAPPTPGDVTRLLVRWNEGSELARAELIRMLYRDLRSHAARLLRAERHDHTLQPTALIHEAYERLVGQRSVRWQNRAHFFAFAAGLMRRILVDHARRRAADRRGRDAPKVALTGEVAAPAAAGDVDVIAVDRALHELAALDPDQARIVELRFFGGLTVIETAEAMEISRATVHREWAMARAWLHRRLADAAGAA